MVWVLISGTLPPPFVRGQHLWPLKSCTTSLSATTTISGDWTPPLNRSLLLQIILIITDNPHFLQMGLPGGVIIGQMGLPSTRATWANKPTKPTGPLAHLKPIDSTHPLNPASDDSIPNANSATKWVTPQSLVLNFVRLKLQPTVQIPPMHKIKNGSLTPLPHITLPVT